jgi:hypothetical protein
MLRNNTSPTFMRIQVLSLIENPFNLKEMGKLRNIHTPDEKEELWEGLMGPDPAISVDALFTPAVLVMNDFPLF